MLSAFVLGQNLLQPPAGPMQTHLRSALGDPEGAGDGGLGQVVDVPQRPTAYGPEGSDCELLGAHPPAMAANQADWQRFGHLGRSDRRGSKWLPTCCGDEKPRAARSCTTTRPDGPERRRSAGSATPGSSPPERRPRRRRAPRRAGPHGGTARPGHSSRNREHRKSLIHDETLLSALRVLTWHDPARPNVPCGKRNADGSVRRHGTGLRGVRRGRVAMRYPEWLDGLIALAAEHGARSGRALDVGCGTGRSLMALRRAGFTAAGDRPLPRDDGDRPRSPRGRRRPGRRRAAGASARPRRRSRHRVERHHQLRRSERPERGDRVARSTRRLRRGPAL